MALGATGTPTTNYSIPKYATSADAPNGTGFNSAMDAIDTILKAQLDAKITAPSGIAAGEAPAWTGSAWGRSSVTRITTIRPQDLQQDAATSGQVLTWNGSIYAPATPAAVPAGVVVPSAAISLPSGWLTCDGSAVSRATYAALFAAVSLSKGTFTVTIASPGVVTLTGHGFIGGEQVYLTTTGALPTGLAIDTTYWVIFVDANTFRLATSQANYLAGTAINTSGSQSGVHTCVQTAYGISGSSNFLLPDLRGRMPVGVGTHADVSALGLNEGMATVGNRRPRHYHETTTSQATGSAGGSHNQVTSSGAAVKTATDLGITNNVKDTPSFAAIQYIIKT